jgi:hypothetical protein
VALKAGRGPAGRRGGGSHTAALAADACEGHGLSVPSLSAGLAEAVRSAVPSVAGASNPVDLGAAAGPGDLARAARLLADSGEVDALIVAAAPLRGRSAAPLRAAVAAVADADIPVVGCSCGEEVASAPALPDGRVVPWLAFPESAARAVAHAARAGAAALRAPDPAPRPPDMDCAAARRLLLETAEGSWLAPEAVEALLAAYGIAVPRARLAGSAAEAAAAQAELGVPVAVKLARPVIPHKSEIGGVRLDCRSEEAAAHAFRAIELDLARSRPGERLEQVFVQEMAGESAELIVGATADEVFGPVVLAGIGGVEAELWADRAVALAPGGGRTAEELWTRLRGAAQLDGWRGAPASDRAALAELVMRVAWLAADQPLLAEIDRRAHVSRDRQPVVPGPVLLPPGRVADGRRPAGLPAPRGRRLRAPRGVAVHAPRARVEHPARLRDAQLDPLPQPQPRRRPGARARPPPPRVRRRGP